MNINNTFFNITKSNLGANHISDECQAFIILSSRCLHVILETIALS